MSVFDSVVPGVNNSHSRYTKSMTKSIQYNARFYERIPVFKHFVLPGDVWRIGGDALVRFMPMMSPTLTGNKLKVRYFFVPLRLLEEDTEIIITGSKNGKLYTGDEKKFKNFVADANKTIDANAYKVQKYGFWDYMRCQVGDYEAIKTDEFLPAQYWDKAYARIDFDYYRDENYDSQDDFDDWYAERAKHGANTPILMSKLPKDYFTSSLPWQLKGTPPAIEVQGQGSTLSFTWNPNYNLGANDLFYQGADADSHKFSISGKDFYSSGGFVSGTQPFIGGSSSYQTEFAKSFNKTLNKTQSVSSGSVTVDSMSFTGEDLREMMQQTRIFERLARCGSRYTEYLRANFGIAPADDTLQRAQYLGGWSIPIVTTEVLQTGEGTNPVGTMRGHGITRGGNRIQTFHVKEFGVILGLAEVRPETQYTTGIPRELSLKRRWDFPNPSLEHLSEDEVRKGELFVSFTDGENDNTLGFQGMYNWLRTAQNEVVADMRDQLSYWNQALHFSSRPEVSGLLEASNHLASFNAPWQFVDPSTSRPFIVEFLNIVDVYRPLARYAVPGYNDHF